MAMNHREFFLLFTYHGSPFTFCDENCLLEHQLAAETPGPVFCVARKFETRYCLFAGNEMPGRTISGISAAIGRLRFRLSWRKVVQRRRNHFENQTREGSRVAL